MRGGRENINLPEESTSTKMSSRCNGDRRKTGCVILHLLICLYANIKIHSSYEKHALHKGMHYTLQLRDLIIQQIL